MHHPTWLLAACCLSTLPAQLTTRLETVDAPGVAVRLTNGTLRSANFPTNSQITGRSNHRTISGSPLQFAHGSLSAGAFASIPAIHIQSNLVIGPGKDLKSMHSTHATTGAAGTSRFRLLLSSKTPIRIRIGWTSFLFSSHTGDYSRVKVSGAFNRSVSIHGDAIHRDSHFAIIPVLGTVALNIELETMALTQQTASSQAISRLDISFKEVADGSFTTFGRSCTTAKIGVTSTPRQGDLLTLTLSGAKPSAISILLVGFSKDRFHFLPLPFDLTSLGLPGCDLNVGYLYQAFGQIDPTGAAKFSVGLPARPGVFYAQWAEWDYLKHSSKLTQGAEIKY